MLPKSGTVTLTGTDQIPAPHPVLLQEHAAVARILHLTAMTETIENVLRDRELVPCLAFDGSTNGLLNGFELAFCMLSKLRRV